MYGLLFLGRENICMSTGTPGCSIVITIVACLGFWTLAQICHLIWLRFKRWPHRETAWEKRRSNRRKRFKNEKMSEKEAKTRYHYNRKEQFELELRENRKRRLYSTMVNRIEARRARVRTTSNHINSSRPYQPPRNWLRPNPLHISRTVSAPVRMSYQRRGASQTHRPARPQPSVIPHQQDQARMQTRPYAVPNTQFGFDNRETFEAPPGAATSPGSHSWWCPPQEPTLTPPPPVFLPRAPMARPPQYLPSREIVPPPVPSSRSLADESADDSADEPGPPLPPRPPRTYLPPPPPPPPPPTNFDITPPALPQSHVGTEEAPPRNGPPARLPRSRSRSRSRNLALQRAASTVSSLSQDEYPMPLDYNISPMNSVRRPTPNHCLAMVPISRALTRIPQPSASHSAAQGQCRSPDIEVWSVHESSLDGSS